VPYISEVVQRLACIALGLCAGEPPPFQPAIAQTPPTGHELMEYRFGVEPMSVTRNLWRRYHPLVREINDAASGYRLRIASGLTTDAYERKLSGEVFDFVIVEPHRVLQAERRNYIVFARAGNQDRIGGVIVVRADAHIQKLRDLHGKTICFGARNALASTLMPRMWLREANFTESAADLLFTGSDETALFRVSRGLAQAAAVSRDAWQRFIGDNPGAGSSMSIRWSTNELSGPAIMAHRRISAEHRDQVAAILTRLDQTERGRAALHASGIRSLRRGDDSSYDDVWEFLTSYSRVFGYSAPGVLP
jgi:ABC-type phosphate/phosphonate transport system substrate-binding protein